jgi:hypothetical protein
MSHESHSYTDHPTPWWVMLIGAAVIAAHVLDAMGYLG